MKNNLKFLCTSSAACAALVAGHDRPTFVSPHIALVIRVEALEALPSNCGLRAALVWHNIGSFFYVCHHDSSQQDSKPVLAPKRLTWASSSIFCSRLFRPSRSNVLLSCRLAHTSPTSSTQHSLLALHARPSHFHIRGAFCL